VTRRLALLQLGAVGVVASGFLAWTDGVAGYALATAVGEAGSDVDGLPPSLLGWAWFLLPLVGFVAWLAIWVPRVPPRRLHLVLGALAALGTAAFLVVALGAGGSLGPGPILALVAGALLVVGDRLPST